MALIPARGASAGDLVAGTRPEKGRVIMKTYRFAVSNWKNPQWSGFWVRKPFASAYEAGIWADRISFRKAASMYIVSLIPETQPLDSARSG